MRFYASLSQEPKNMKGSRMKFKHKIPLLSIGFGALVFIGFAGTISSSLAWWAYSTRASIGYYGTSVASSEQLQVGIKTKIDLHAFGMSQVYVGEDDPETDEDERVSYYFCDAGTGLQADAIAYYLRAERKYAVDELMPVTSGSYGEGDTLNLKSSLVSGVAFNNIAAEKEKYVFIPLAFRVMKYNYNGVLEPAKGENIWLSETVVEASTTYDGSVYKAIRMYTEGYQATKVNDVTTLVPVKRLINPSSTEEDMGETAVAGILDLSGSGYYDTYEKQGGEYTLVYGETENDTQSTDNYIQELAETGLENFNGVQFITPQQANESSTFYAKYSEGVWHPTNKEAIKAKVQEYDTLNTVKAEDSSSGVLSGGKPLCATDLTTGVADLDLTVWLEGWDHNVIDKENRHSFNLGLQFMISRL